MQRAINEHIGYAPHAHATPREQAERFRETLREEEFRARDFDTLVGTGLSGALIVPSLARIMHKDWLLVRKPDDDSHHGSDLVGNLGKRWLFVDDFISTGASLRRVVLAINNRTYYLPNNQKPKFVGAYQYQRRSILTPADVRREWGIVARALNGERK